MNINLKIFESKFDFNKINLIKSLFILVESIFISVEFFFISTQISLVTVDISTSIKAKTLKTIKLTNAFIFINVSKNSKFLLPKFVKENALANSIKKRKLKTMKKILLFSFELNQQKIKQTMQQVKSALITAYFFVENADIFITIDFINQIIDGKLKIFEKIQFSNINDKLDQILKKIDSFKNFHEQFFKRKKSQTQIFFCLLSQS